MAVSLFRPVAVNVGTGALSYDSGVQLTSGRYYFTGTPAATSTSNTLTNTQLRLVPWYVPSSCTLSRIGAEVTATGEAGSKIRLGIYADDGTGMPGALVLDAGQIAGDSATVQELTISQDLSPGLYWFGGAVQLAPSSLPTLRAVVVSTGAIPIYPTVSHATSTPGANASSVGATMTGVSAALPASFTWTGSVTTAAPRVFVKVA